MRCIDVDALIEFIENRYNITWKDDYEGGIKDACVDILEEINKMPTIEPERKKGQWIPKFNGMFKGGAYWFKCSECERIVPEVRNGGWNYCPNCGADMRQPEEGNV